MKSAYSASVQDTQSHALPWGFACAWHTRIEHFAHSGMQHEHQITGALSRYGARKGVVRRSPLSLQVEGSSPRSADGVGDSSSQQGQLAVPRHDRHLLLQCSFARHSEHTTRRHPSHTIKA